MPFVCPRQNINNRVKANMLLTPPQIIGSLYRPVLINASQSNCPVLIDQMAYLFIQAPAARPPIMFPVIAGIKYTPAKPGDALIVT
jgi:hypothetical protein